MNQFMEWAARLLSSWKFWIVIPPWDNGVRVRLSGASVTPTGMPPAGVAVL